jgi:2-polyprenyl-3-methyl-5-hydroxy-6-metoxy-1,4-benzoquinol methylase
MARLSTREKAGIRRRVIRAYDDWIVRLYCTVRFRIMNMRILEEIEQYVPAGGRTLDLGCGFGLFSLFYVLCDPRRRMLGIDLSEGRIRMAKRASGVLRVEDRVVFRNMDVRQYGFGEPMGAVVAIDLVHHLLESQQRDILAHCCEVLEPGGILLIKDVDARPWPKVVFTWVLDKLMAPRTPVRYIHRDEMVERLTQLGLDVKVHNMLDILPYPHLLYVCRKPRNESGGRGSEPSTELSDGRKHAL